MLCGHAAECGLRHDDATYGGGGALWKPGDVIGVFCDAEAGTIGFQLNGRDVEGTRTFRYRALPGGDGGGGGGDDGRGGGSDEVESQQLIPVVAVEFGAVLSVNLGHQPFCHAQKAEYSTPHKLGLENQSRLAAELAGASAAGSGDGGGAKGGKPNDPPSNAAASGKKGEPDDVVKAKEAEQRRLAAEEKVESNIKTDPNALVVWSGSLTSIERKTVKQMVGGAPSSMVSSLSAKELCPSVGPMNATVKNGRWYYEVRHVTTCAI